MGRRELAAIVVCATLWVVAAGGWVGYLASERVLMGDLYCPIAPDSSDYGEATWGWFPPGVTCAWEGVTYNGTEHVLVEGPPFGRVATGGVLLAWAGTLGALVWSARTSRSSEDDAVPSHAAAVGP